MRTDDPKLKGLKIGKRLNRLARFLESAIKGLRLLRIFNSGARGGYILELAWAVENDQLDAWDEAYPVIDTACDNSLPKASQPDFAQGNLIYRGQLIEALEDVYHLRFREDKDAVSDALGKLIQRLQTDPKHLSV